MYDAKCVYSIEINTGQIDVGWNQVIMLSAYHVLISSGVYWIFGIGFPLNETKMKKNAWKIEKMNTNLSNSLLEIELNCLYEFAMVENSTRLLRYTGSLKPGWSASSSVPYIRTFWTLSKSDIFRGNQKMSPKSILWENQNLIEPWMFFRKKRTRKEKRSTYQTMSMQKVVLAAENHH